LGIGKDGLRKSHGRCANRSETPDRLSRAKEFFMNKVTRIVSISTLALAALASGAAHADPGKTREQVQAELVAAQKAGDVPVGEDGLTPRERFPWLYPAVGTAEPGKTREQVKAELAAAQQNGDIVMSFAGKTERELFPGRHPASESAQNIAHSDTGPSTSGAL